MRHYVERKAVVAGKGKDIILLIKSLIYARVLSIKQTWPKCDPPTYFCGPYNI